MLCLSQGVGYAIKALTCLEASDESKGFVRDLAEASGVPKAYLAKLFKKLVDAGLLESKRGWAGGTRLARPASEISLLEISEAIEGQEWFGRCLLGMAECSDERACPAHDFWKATRGAIKEKLRRTSLADVIAFERKRAGKPSAISGDDPFFSPPR